ncbi:hypothetical protein PV10_07421 [Exophiala mesophila]|uniref:Zn(2)-C6 fungal-type domain-containing protein n=1 Tax=Exophiala mesophila TaxID=212818 RepID=A0A0D1Z7X2_EXOME|nr:uncharacterized protein PV10_07421 [Exophiala mesophila]KIV90079.1 hypothetical protein PV10_07421 [Exophiala mesophila]
MAESSDEQAGAAAAVDSLLPCDACRRRKVKCSKSEPCDRCLSTGLRCTRDIARKKRGPKKGSGSVIAKLRDETLHASIQDSNLPPFDLSTLRLQMSALNRTLSNDSPIPSPLSSPSSSHFGDTYLQTSDTSVLPMPRSIPLDMQNGNQFEPIAHTAFAQGGIHLPASWQMQPSEQLLFQPPISPSGYLSVSDLAQQIFPDSMPTSTQSQPAMSPQTYVQPPSRTSTPLIHANSIDAMLKPTPVSPSTTTTSSPMPQHGPKYLYRSDSGNLAIEPRIHSLASEVGMSAYLMSQCIRQYFRHLYPIRPMIHESSFHQRLQSSEDLSLEEKVLVLSLCAMTVLHAAPESDLTLDKKLQLGKQFLDACFFLRTNVDWTETATLLSVQASYHMCVALFELKKPRAHHFYIREAIGLALDLGLHLDSTYLHMSELTAICARRTFAILFITERGLAILRNKPTLITRIPRLSPEYFDEQDGIVLAGFSALVNLFSILDEKFVRLWSTSAEEDVSATEPIDNIAALQHGLNEMMLDHFAMTDIQKADVLVTRHWLRLIFWQASMRQGLISYSAADPIFSSSYPITIGQDLCNSISDISYEAVLVHGLGIFEKLFEVAYTLMDALTIANVGWSESRELKFLFDLLAASPNSQNTYVKMLATKIETERSQSGSPHGMGGIPFTDNMPQVIL